MPTSLSGRGVNNAWDNVVASVTDQVLVPGIATKKIRVLSYIVIQGDTTASTVQFNSKGAGVGTPITPIIKAAPNDYVDSDFYLGLFETVAGEALTVTTGAGSTSSVAIVYELLMPA